MTDTSHVSADRGVYVVTGAGSGFGREISRRLLEAGCQVSAWDRETSGLADLACSRLGVVGLDVRDKAAQARAAQDAAASAGGQIAGLVAAAGIMEVAPFLEVTEEQLDRALTINLKGTLFSVQAVLPYMRKARRGSIVMFSSMQARSAGPNAAAYIASKGGIYGLARSMAMELATDGIRTNTISPAIADTPMPRAHYADTTLAERGAANPMGRLATTADIAETALFLLSEDASFITGQDIRLTGGARLF